MRKIVATFDLTRRPFAICAKAVSIFTVCIALTLLSGPTPSFATPRIFKSCLHVLMSLREGLVSHRQKLIQQIEPLIRAVDPQLAADQVKQFAERSVEVGLTVENRLVDNSEIVGQAWTIERSGRDLSALPYLIATNRINLYLALEHVAQNLRGYSRYWLKYIALLNRTQQQAVFAIVTQQIVRNSGSFYWFLKSLPTHELRVDFIETAYQVIPDFSRRCFLDFAVLHTIPMARLPESLRSELRGNWSVDWQHSPPAVIASTAIRNDCSQDFHHAGHCSAMWEGYSSTVLESANHRSVPQADNGKLVLVFVQKQLIGAIKLKGEESFLAFQNLVNERGETVLVAGGVYRITNQLFETKIKSLRAGGGAANAQVSYSIYLDSIELEPRTFLLNPAAVTYGDTAGLPQMPSGGFPHRMLNDFNEGELREFWRYTLDLIQSVHSRLSVGL